MPYVSNWIELGAQAIQQERARLRQNLDFQESLRKTLTVNSQNVLGVLLESVSRAVEEFNGHFPATEEKLSKPEMLGMSGFQIRRPYDPVFILTVRTDPNTPAIVWDAVRSGGATGLYSVNGSFEVRAEPSGDGRLFLEGSPIDFDAAAQRLLLPALEGLV
jgi:hypothetical protein